MFSMLSMLFQYTEIVQRILYIKSYAVLFYAEKIYALEDLVSHKYSRGTLCIEINEYLVF